MMCSEKTLNTVQTWLPGFSAMQHYTTFGMASYTLPLFLLVYISLVRGNPPYQTISISDISGLMPCAVRQLILIAKGYQDILHVHVFPSFLLIFSRMTVVFSCLQEDFSLEQPALRHVAQRSRVTPCQRNGF